MAQQKGIIPLKGTIGNITFYKSKDGYLAREKTDITADRIANDPAFQRTRENGAEFGRGGKGGKIIRTALRPLLQHASDKIMTARLTRVLIQVIKADPVNGRGMRNLTDGNLLLLEGFDFNGNSKLGTSLFAPFSVTADRVAGSISISIPAYVPGSMISAPAGTTHFKVNGAGLEVDFAGNQYVADLQQSGMLPLDNQATAPLDLTHAVTANSILPLFAVLGIEFFQEVNGEMYPLKNGAFNALSLVKVYPA